MSRGKLLYWEQQEMIVSDCLKDTRNSDILVRQHFAKKLVAIRWKLAILEYRTIVRWFKEI